MRKVLALAAWRTHQPEEPCNPRMVAAVEQRHPLLLRRELAQVGVGEAHRALSIRTQHLVPTVIEAGRDPAAKAPAANRMFGLCEPTACKPLCARHWNGTAEVEADLARLDERRMSGAEPAHYHTDWRFPPNHLGAVGAQKPPPGRGWWGRHHARGVELGVRSQSVRMIRWEARWEGDARWEEARTSTYVKRTRGWLRG